MVDAFIPDIDGIKGCTHAAINIVDGLYSVTPAIDFTMAIK